MVLFYIIAVINWMTTKDFGIIISYPAAYMPMIKSKCSKNYFPRNYLRAPFHHLLLASKQFNLIFSSCTPFRYKKTEESAISKRNNDAKRKYSHLDLQYRLLFLEISKVQLHKMFKMLKISKKEF